MNAYLPLLLLTFFVPLMAHAATDMDAVPAIPVSGIRISGVADGATLGKRDIMDLDVTLALTQDGYVAPSPGLPNWTLRLRDIRAPFGTHVMFRDSAIRTLVERVRLAHEEHGGAPVTVGVGPEILASLQEPGSDGLLVIQVTPAAHTDPAQESPAAAERRIANSILGTVRAVSFHITGEGLPAENDLLALTVELGWDEYAIPAGYVAPKRSLPAREVALWDIGRLSRKGIPLYGSAISAMLDQVRVALVKRGHANAEVRLSPQALGQLSRPRGNGLLEIEVSIPAGS